MLVNVEKMADTIWSRYSPCIYILTYDVSSDRTGEIQLEKGYSISLTHFCGKILGYKAEQRLVPLFKQEFYKMTRNRTHATRQSSLSAGLGTRLSFVTS